MDISAKWLLYPLPSKDFFDKFWEKESTVIQGRGSDYFDSILTISEVDSIISSALVAENNIRIIKGAEHIEKTEFISNDGLIDPVEVCKLFERGYTVVLEQLHRTHEGLKGLCVKLANDLGLTFHTNLYLTPPNSQGFLAHYDTHDVFILQIHGEKLWKIFESPYPLPLKGQDHHESCADSGSIQSEINLRPGDLIYLPRGCIHSAECCDQTSLHITLGIHSRTWSEFIIEAMSIACTKDKRLRESLPIKFLQRLNPDAVDITKNEFNERIEIILGLIDFEELSRHYFVEANSRVRPRLQNVLTNSMGISKIDMNTSVVCASELARVRQAGDTIEVIGFEKTINVPEYCEEQVRTLLSGSIVKLHTLRGSLDDESIVSLARRLVREGLLKILPNSE